MAAALRVASASSVGLHEHYGPAGVDRPGMMWVLFAVLAGITAVSLVVYDRWMKTRVLPIAVGE